MADCVAADFCGEHGTKGGSCSAGGSSGWAPADAPPQWGHEGSHARSLGSGRRCERHQHPPGHCVSGPRCPTPLRQGAQRPPTNPQGPRDTQPACQPAHRRRRAGCQTTPEAPDRCTAGAGTACGSGPSTVRRMGRPLKRQERPQSGMGGWEQSALDGEVLTRGEGRRAPYFIAEPPCGAGVWTRAGLRQALSR